MKSMKTSGAAIKKLKCNEVYMCSGVVLQQFFHSFYWICGKWGMIYSLGATAQPLICGAISKMWLNLMKYLQTAYISWAFVIAIQIANKPILTLQLSTFKNANQTTKPSPPQKKKSSKNPKKVGHVGLPCVILSPFGLPLSPWRCPRNGRPGVGRSSPQKIQELKDMYIITNICAYVKYIY